MPRQASSATKRKEERDKAYAEKLERYRAKMMRRAGRVSTADPQKSLAACKRKRDATGKFAKELREESEHADAVVQSSSTADNASAVNDSQQVSHSGEDFPTAAEGRARGGKEEGEMEARREEEGEEEEEMEAEGEEEGEDAPLDSTSVPTISTRSLQLWWSIDQRLNPVPKTARGCPPQSPPKVDQAKQLLLDNTTRTTIAFLLN